MAAGGTRSGSWLHMMNEPAWSRCAKEHLNPPPLHKRLPPHQSAIHPPTSPPSPPPRREGNKAPKKDPGFVVFVLKPLPHSRFTRRGADLVHKLTLPLYKALVGTSVDVETLDHRCAGRVGGVGGMGGGTVKVGLRVALAAAS